MRLATFAQAIAKTSAEIHISRCRLEMIFVAQFLNTGAARRETQCLLGNRVAFARLQLRDGAKQPLLQLHLHVRADLFRVAPRRDAADYVQPILLREINERHGSVDERLVRDGNPKRGGIREAISKEGGRRDSNHGERLAVDRERPRRPRTGRRRMFCCQAR